MGPLQEHTPANEEPERAQSGDYGLRGTLEEQTRLLRVASMTREMLAEVRQVTLDADGRQRLRGVYDRTLGELKGVLSEDLERELDELTIEFDGTPSEGELRVAQAQLVGWLEGLFRGIQAALYTQQVESLGQLQQLRRLPGGGEGQQERPQPGLYL